MKIRLEPGACMPTRAHDTDAGLDLYAMEGQIVEAKGSAVFRTGVHVELPGGCAGLLVSKSGLNVHAGLTSTGLIDEGYSGEILVKLYNNSDDDYMVNRGDKISQLVVLPVRREPLELVDEIAAGDRGEDGFGSSGR